MSHIQKHKITVSYRQKHTVQYFSEQAANKSVRLSLEQEYRTDKFPLSFLLYMKILFIIYEKVVAAWSLGCRVSHCFQRTLWTHTAQKEPNHSSLYISPQNLALPPPHSPHAASRSRQQSRRRAVRPPTDPRFASTDLRRRPAR
jgi:hypothetical protein